MSRSRVYVDRNRMEKEQEDAMVMCSLILLHNSGHLLFDLLIACAKRQRLAASRTFAYVSVGFRDSNFSSKYPGFPFAKSLCHLAIFLVPTRYINQKSTKPRGRCSRQPRNLCPYLGNPGIRDSRVGMGMGMKIPSGRIWGLDGAGSSWDMSGLGIFLTFFAWLCLGWKKCNFDGSLYSTHVLLQHIWYLFFSCIALFHIYLKRVYANVYILFFKISVWIYICGPHDIWIELWVPHSCLFPTTTFLGHASFNAPKVSSCFCRDVPNTKDHLDSNIHEQWVRRPQYNGVWTLAFQDTKLHCWSTKLLRCDSRSRTLRGVRLFLFFATKKHHLFFGGEVGKPLESPWPFPFFSGRNQVHPNAAAHPLGSFGSNPAIRSLLWVEDDGLWSPRLSGVTSYAVG